nr:MAG TPA: hypothetical protein [Caudoviricetes sp.]
MMNKYYLNDYGNIRMREFLLRNGDIKQDERGIYVVDAEDYQDFQEQFDSLEYFKSVQKFVQVFDLEYMLSKGNYVYYVRVVEDDGNNVFSLIYESQDSSDDVTMEDVVEITHGDILNDNLDL